MAAQKGRAFLAKKGDGATPSESFTTVAGLLENSFSINGEAVDVTTKDSNGFRELLAGAGISSLSMTGSGVLTDATTHKALQDDVLNGTIHNYEMAYPDGSKWMCGFQLITIEDAGADSDGVKYSLSYESSGQPTYTAAP